MKEFILQNWKLIASGLLVLISFFISILRKRPVDDILTWIYIHCVKAINLSEEECELYNLKGSVKLHRAENYVLTWLKSQFPEINIEDYRTSVRKAIEDILSTPEKKKGGTSDAK